MIFERICADDYDQIAPMAYVLMSCHAAQYPHLFSPPILVLSKRQFRAKLRQKTFVGIKAEESSAFAAEASKPPKTKKPRCTSKTFMCSWMTGAGESDKN